MRILIAFAAIFGAAIAQAAPAISVTVNGGGSLVNGQGVVNFGKGTATLPGPMKTFVVTNVGASALILGTVSVPTGYVVLDGLPAQLAAGATDELKIGLKTLSVGDFNGSIVIASNDATNGQFNIPVAGSVGGVVLVNQQTSAAVKAVYSSSTVDSVIIGQFWDPDNTGTFAHPELLDAQLANVPVDYSGILVLDWEGKAGQILYGGPATAGYAATIQEFINVYNYTKLARPNAIIGYYGLPYYKYEPITQQWHDNAVALSPIFEHVDALFPAAYDFYPDSPNPQDNVVFLSYVTNNIKLALEVSGGKPLFPYLWPRYHDQNYSSPYGAQRIPDAEAKAHWSAAWNAEYNGDRPEGVVWWGADYYYRSLSTHVLPYTDYDLYKAQMLSVEVFGNEIPSGMSDDDYFNGLHTNQLKIFEEVVLGQPYSGSWNPQPTAYSHINVSYAGAAISNGQSVPIPVGIGEATFTVTNTGPAALWITSVAVPSGFIVTNLINVYFPPGASDTFTIKLAVPLSQSSGTVSLLNGDPNQSPFTFSVKASSAIPAGTPLFMALEPTPFSIGAVWSAGASTAVVGYKIDVTTVFNMSGPDYSAPWWYQDYNVGAATSFQIQGLMPNQVYFVRLRSYDSTGQILESVLGGYMTPSPPSSAVYKLFYPGETGILSHPSGASVSVPASAFSTPVTVSITTKTATPGVGGLVSRGLSVSLGPDGQQFLQNLTLTIPISPGTEEAAIFYWNPAPGRWEVQNSVDSGGTVQAQLGHFSLYAPFTKPAAVAVAGIVESYAYPNPSRRSMPRFRVRMNAAAQRVKISVYNVAGERVMTSDFDAPQAQGDGSQLYEMPWRDDGVASGVYLYAIRAETTTGGVETRGRVAIIR